MGYPLDAGGVADYPVKVGSMLLTLVEPAPGFERAYNRWYERDHFYGGCMVGPWLFAGSRWVATRALKDLRWPAESTVARPTDAGSYLAVYWVEQGHHHDHFADWSIHQVRDLYASGRGFAERTHVHTSTFGYVGASYRDDDPVPVELALDHGYDGLIVLWWDAATGTGADLADELASGYVPDLLAGSPVEIVASWVPSSPDADDQGAPMDLGSPAGGPDRLVQLLFVGGDTVAALDQVRDVTEAVESAGTAVLQLAAPFFRTVVGTDAYVDEL
jgi:hypothetical protein